MAISYVSKYISSFVYPLEMISVVVYFYLSLPSFANQQIIFFRVAKKANLFGVIAILAKYGSSKHIQAYYLSLESSQKSSSMIFV